jgi:acyl-CoA dehydrogenase
MSLANGARLIELVRHFGLDDDPLTRGELARLYENLQVARWNNQRALDKVKAGQAPGPEMSIAKMALTRNMQLTGDFVSKVLGPKLVADTGEWGTYAWNKFLLGTPGMRVAGGTDEVLRNIVSERVLGLPKEPGIDTTSPFKDLAQN